MINTSIKWEVLYKPKTEKVVDILLQNRGINSKKDKEIFLKPILPEKLSLLSLGIKKGEIEKAVIRIKKAIKNKEGIVIYGDYDADGICATAILWKCLYRLTKKILPYLPDRFTEGYGINPESIEKIKKERPETSLIITVDNGIVAYDAIKKATILGIDVIISDHHAKEKKLPKVQSIIHTVNLSGSGIAWIFTREIKKRLIANHQSPTANLDLAAIGTISDQVPLLGANRSIVKYGLNELNNTQNLGLLSLIEEASLKKGFIGTYEVGFVIAPRLNAMGRLEHAIDSLRLLCSNNKEKVNTYSKLLSKTNTQRQDILGEVVLHAKKLLSNKIPRKIIVLSHESYHEGVIGLAASKLVEQYYRPAIVFSKGITYSKASARSISGFNIIEAIRKLGSVIVEGGGHPMAAGFTIETDKIEIFTEELERVSALLLTDEILAKTLKIDLELSFGQVNKDLYESILEFEPAGTGNPQPVFATKKVNVFDARTVGKGAVHLKLKLEKDDKVFDAIAFNMGNQLLHLSPDKVVDIAYNITENVWNGRRSLELKIKDIRLAGR